MAKFKCKLSGTVIEFIHPVDIASTQRNPAYEELQDGVSIKDRNYSAASDSTCVQTKEEQKPKEEVKKAVKKTAKVEE